MMCEEGHPNTSLSDWEAFGQGCSPLLFEQVIERKDCNVPNWFVPLARGAVIASPYLLRRIGYMAGMGCPPDWHEMSPAYFERHLQYQSYLMVRDCEGTNLWTVERLGGRRRHRDVDDVLVHVFGSTPVLTRSHQSAMWLAEHCHAKGPPNGLRWIKAIPQHLDRALATVKDRETDERIVALLMHY